MNEDAKLESQCADYFVRLMEKLAGKSPGGVYAWRGEIADLFVLLIRSLRKYFRSTNE